MPFMDGSALVRIIRADTRFADLKLIMMTTISHPLTNADLTRLQAYLTKPLSFSRLYAQFVELQQAKAETTYALKPSVDNINELPTQQVLLVEDNPTNQKVALLMLKKLNCEVTIANNGRHALTILEQHNFNFDVIFMDCQMPEMDGFEATAQIRQYEAQRELNALPIIALTANAMTGDAQYCLASGMNGYLSKPVKTHELQHALQQWGRQA